MPRITLVNLETLCCIAKLGTFAAAAEKLHASQPAISARIRDLESALGVELFRRQGRRMELTLQGRELIEMVEPLLQRIHGVVDAIDKQAVITGTLRIGVGEFAALSWFATFMARLHERMPRVTWHVDVDLTAAMADKLKAGKLDVALLAGPLVAPAIRTASLGTVQMVWVGAPSVLDGETPLESPVDVLRSHAIWALTSPSASHTMTQSSLAELDVAPDSISTCNHTRSLIEIVVAGAGVALLPEVLVRGHLAKSELVRLLPDLQHPALEFVIAWHDAAEQPLVRGVVDLARQSSSFD
jgi:DNA-binding transcriptional LysR family regulator